MCTVKTEYHIFFRPLFKHGHPVTILVKALTTPDHLLAIANIEIRQEISAKNRPGYVFKLHPHLEDHPLKT